MTDFDRRRQSNPRAQFARRESDLLIHVDFGDRETVPMDLMDSDDSPRLPVGEVRELFGEAAMRAIYEADSQLNGRSRI